MSARWIPLPTRRPKSGKAFAPDERAPLGPKEPVELGSQSLPAPVEAEPPDHTSILLSHFARLAGIAVSGEKPGVAQCRERLVQRPPSDIFVHTEDLCDLR
jgi:hypothetical protein